MLALMLKILMMVLAIVSLIVNNYSLSVYAQEKNKESKLSRNPFMPLVTSDGRLISLDREKAKSDLIVEGTVFDKYGRSYAIVNSLIVEVGDTINGFRVLKVEQGKVTFMKDGQTKVVEVKEFKDEPKKEEER
ncbi:MAG: hypothetical protein AMJ95_03525 [Omnitrophica WOR_2 bacterium SM23_72]|nr:MAG: hypothetical protein AMJ95_03525 [Omnitrophica WOR_2 bacterium SM23_72]